MCFAWYLRISCLYSRLYRGQILVDLLCTSTFSETLFIKFWFSGSSILKSSLDLIGEIRFGSLGAYVLVLSVLSCCSDTMFPEEVTLLVLLIAEEARWLAK